MFYCSVAKMSCRLNQKSLFWFEVKWHPPEPLRHSSLLHYHLTAILGLLTGIIYICNLFPDTFCRFFHINRWQTRGVAKQKQDLPTKLLDRIHDP